MFGVVSSCTRASGPVVQASRRPRAPVRKNPYQKPLPLFVRPMSVVPAKAKLLQPTVHCGELRSAHVGNRGKKKCGSS